MTYPVHKKIPVQKPNGAEKAGKVIGNVLGSGVNYLLYVLWTWAAVGIINADFGTHIHQNAWLTGLLLWGFFNLVTSAAKEARK